MKKILLPFAVLAIVNTANAQFPKVLERAGGAIQGKGSGLTNEEVVAGLKEALGKGAVQAVGHASKLDGFWGDPRLRIPFPPEADRMKTTLVKIGIEPQVNEFELTMNRAAENASKEAAAIFLSAIKGMSVSDGFAILKGGDNAATQFLRERTTTELRSRFRPIVEKATSEVALSSYWSPLAGAYNKAGMFTGTTAVDPDLDGYITEKAIDGLFLLVADEEARIRKDPMARTSDLLQRVFGN